ncbi:hypothetical protein EMIT079MI2_620006 [Bacillus sp. IT-79MI2]
MLILHVYDIYYCFPLDKYRQVETSIQEKQARFTFNILNSNKGA